MASKTEQKISNLTMVEMRIACVLRMLSVGYVATMSGKDLELYLSKNVDNIEDIFGLDNQVYIRMKTRDKNIELYKLAEMKKIGDLREWVKFKDSDMWYLHIWWK